MTGKQRRFAELYLIHLNCTKAFILAGYAPKHADSDAHKLLKHPEVAAYIKKEQNKLTRRMNKSKEDIISDLEDIINEYKLTGKLTGNALRAIDLLNKMVGYNEPDRAEITHSGISITINKPSDSSEEPLEEE